MTKNHYSCYWLGLVIRENMRKLWVGFSVSVGFSIVPYTSEYIVVVYVRPKYMYRGKNRI